MAAVLAVFVAAGLRSAEAASPATLERVAGITFSLAGGTFRSPIKLTLATPTPGATILYTTNPYKTGPYELYTRDDHWRPEVRRLLDNYFPRRTGVVIRQFRASGLFP